MDLDVNFNVFFLNFFSSGVHHKKKQCDTSKVTKKVKDILVKAKTYWFPPDVVVAKVVPKRTKKQKNPKGMLYFLLC